MKIGLVGASYQQRSLPFDAQRSVNLFPILDQQGKEVSALYGRPGLSLFGTAGIGPGRGAFSATNGRAFEVSGSGLYEINSNGTSTLRGSLDTSSGLVTVDENGFQLAVCDGNDLYIFTYATNAFAKVVTANLIKAITVTFLDGYFIVNSGGGKFQISKLYDGLVWAALDFATAESSPDDLLRVLNVVGQLWLFGGKTTEIWSNTGGSSFPFQKIGGAKLETGISGGNSAIPLDNSVFWAGRDNSGTGIIYRANGFTPQRISTEAIELRLQAAPTPDTLRSTSYQEEGHTFYILTGGGMSTALVYDLATQLWHEWSFLDQYGNYSLPLQAFIIFAFNKQLAIDRSSGNIYIQSLNYYSDNGEEIARDRIYTHLSEENQRFIAKNLTIGFETGVGTQTGQGVDPKCTLYISRDGARSWTGGVIKSIGRVGEYLKRVTFFRLGQARILTFWIRITDPVKVSIIGSYLNAGQ